MPIFIETVMPVWTTIAVCLVITFAVHIFEDVRTWFIFLSGRSICFLVLHTTPCFLSVVFGHMSFIALGTPKDMRATTKCRMSPLPTVLALQNTWVHISTFDSSDETSNVKATIYDVLCQRTTLGIPDVQPDYHHV